MNITFDQLGLSSATLAILMKKGFVKPTEIQAKSIPLLLKNEKDLIAQSQTGSGKTASFSLPILEKMKKSTGKTQVIVLAPTRELALQVTKEIESLRGDRGFHIVTVYGGASMHGQIEQLKQGADIIVGTPGRVVDLKRRNFIQLDQLDYVVLDEADEMLKMGFEEDLNLILSDTPVNKRMLLFSATMPQPILRIAQNYMDEYDLVRVKQKMAPQHIEQVYYTVTSKNRGVGLCRIIDSYSDFYGIIFCNTKFITDQLAEFLRHRGYQAAALHGDVSQAQREKILDRFKKRKSNILVATDVVARGIDVNNLSHVVNFSLPQHLDSYVHRVGRTGRAGKAGVAISLVLPGEQKTLRFIERNIQRKLERKDLPSAEESRMRARKEVKDYIAKGVAEGEGEDQIFQELADELMKSHAPDALVRVLLRKGFGRQLMIREEGSGGFVLSMSPRPQGVDRRRRSTRGRSRRR